MPMQLFLSPESPYLSKLRVVMFTPLQPPGQARPNAAGGRVSSRGLGGLNERLGYLDVLDN